MAAAEKWIMASLLIFLMFSLLSLHARTAQAEDCPAPQQQLSPLEPRECWDVQGRPLQPGEVTLPEGATCRLQCPFSPSGLEGVDPPSVLVKCWQGHWEGGVLPCGGTSSDDAAVEVKVREKRLIGTLILLGTAIASIFIGRELTRDKNPPQILCPNVPTTRNEDRVAFAQVTWEEPTKAYDAEEKQSVSVRRTSAEGPGWTFLEGETPVWYAAKDSSGNEARCKVVIRVEVETCAGPLDVDHGRYSCHPAAPSPGGGSGGQGGAGGGTAIHRYVRGTRCSFSCNEGYWLHGPSTRSCVARDQWSDSLPTCKAVTCPAPPHLPSASFSCSDAFNFLSVCTYSCSAPGFAIEAGTSSVLVCGASRSWRGATPRCVDVEPPRFEQCHTLQTLLVDKGDNSVEATWREPVVRDNSGEAISPEYQGPLSRGESARPGIYRLVYSAGDSAGNNATECTITLIIKELRCPPLFPKPHHRLQCASGSRLGSSCSFSCDKGYELNGSDVSHCVKSDTSPHYAFWKWNKGTQPQCVAKEGCPALEPPTNGALACDISEGGDYCKILCQEGTDIAFKWFPARDLLVCLIGSVRRWNFHGSLPECTRTTNSDSLKMDASYSYYTERCFEPSAQRQIKEKFIAFMRNGTRYKEVCIDNPNCNVQNVEVTCGPVRERRSSGDQSRDQSADQTGGQEGGASGGGGAYRVRLSFQLQMPMLHSQSPRQDFLDSSWALYRAVEVLQQELNQSLADLLGPEAANGSLPVSVLQLEPSQPQLVCPPGSLPAIKSLACVECPRGSYFDASNESCVPCPAGQYQSQTGQRECLACPQLSTTLQPGATSLGLCRNQCPPGQTSAEGVVPCTPCARGYYQHQHGQTSCLPCPLSQATLNEGAQTSAECQEFDLAFAEASNASASLELSEPRDLDLPLTAALWFRRDTEESAPLLNLTWDLGELRVRVEQGGYVTVALDGRAFMEFANVTSGQWHHLVVEVGELETSAVLDRKSRNVSSSLALASSTSSPLSVSLGGEGFVGSVSQLDLWSGRGSPPPPSLTPRCQQPPGVGGDVLGWRAWLLQARDRGALLQLPSLCDDTDECTSGPCLHGACADKFRDFRCTCDPGFTGKACEVNLDDCVAHLCNNNATCVDGVTNYTCICPPQYTGAFCDDVIMAGNWGPWSAWSAWSVSCGRGSHSRARRCDSPPPQNGGLPCQGNSTQTEAGDLDPCPECVELEAPEHGGLQCQEEGGLRRCQLTCQEGFDFDVEPLPEYTCGLQSGYQWNLQTEKNPGRRLPNCVEVKPAKEVTTVYSATYRNLSCTDQEFAAEATTRITEVVVHITGSLECVRLERCRISHVVTDCEAGGSRSKRAASMAGLSITLSNSPSSVGMEVWIEDSESAVQQLNSSGRSGAFTVQVQGQHYELDISSGQFSGQVTCRQGWAKVSCYCVPCGPGTYWVSGDCLPCPVGRYQGESSQSACLPCPSGWATPGEASITVQECTVPCGPGTYWVSGDCLPCPVGRYQGESSQSACLPCPSGWATPGEASITVQECTVDVSTATKAIIWGPVVAFVAIVVVIGAVLIWRSKKREQVKPFKAPLPEQEYEVKDTTSSLRFCRQLEEITLPQERLASGS